MSKRTIYCRFRSAFASVFAAVALLLFVGLGLRAQQTTGSVLGTVLDPSGAAVPNVQITITNQDTGAVRNAVSGADGVYNAPQIPAGTYTIEAMAQGFSPVEVKDVVVAVASTARVDLKIAVGSVTQSVTVSGEAPLVDTTSSSLGGIVDEQRVADLPLNGRNWTDLTLMQSGITQSRVIGSSNSAATGIPGESGTTYSSNGATYRSNYFSLDGANMATVFGLSPASISNTSLGVDGIKEYKVVTSMFSAEYGMRMGSQTTIVSKGGTNQFHGDAFEYLRNSSLDARNYFDALDTQNVNGFGTDKSVVYPGKRIPPFRRNNFGGSFGGPIKKDKTFFYAVFEGIRQQLGVTITDKTLPAACYVNGAVPAVIKNNSCVSGSATTPITVNPYILPVANLFPAPNVVGYSTFNYTFPYIQPTSEEYGQIRVDHTFSDSDTFFARYTGDHADTQAFGAYPGFSTTDLSMSDFGTLAENHVFSPALLNSFRFSFSRTTGSVFPSVNPALITPAVTFVPGNGIGSISPGGGVTALGPPTTAPNAETQNLFTLSDDVFWTKGKHAFKFGTLINYFRVYPYEAFTLPGTANFSALSNFFTGVYSNIQVERPGSQYGLAFHYSTFGFYGQDDYRITSRVTLNLGLRYEFYTVPTEMNPALATTVRNPLTDTTGTPGAPFLNNSFHDFSPRVGFAWDVTGKGTTAVKGGAGIYYDIGSFGTVLYNMTIDDPPISANYQIQNSLAIPKVPFTVPITIATNQPESPRVAQYNLQQPTLGQYNLMVEQQLPWGIALNVGYLGSRGWHLYQTREGDPTVSVGTTATGLPIFGCWNTAQTAYELATSTGACPAGFANVGPRTNPAWGQFQLNTSDGNSYYNSLQVTLNKRISQGLQFQLAYTWSKLLDEGQGLFAGGESTGEASQLTAFENELDDRGPSETDVASNLRANMIYHVPNIRSDGFAAKFLNGWWLSSIVSAQSGYPITPQLSSGSSGGGVGGDRELQSSNYVFERPNLDPSFNKATAVTGTVTQWFNPTMYDLQAVGTLGNEGRGLLRGPGFEDVDFSVVKDTKAAFLGEAGNIEFRAEFFNILNHANFALPNTTIFSASSTINSLASGQIGSSSLPVFSSAGQITSTVSNSRQVQFALKILF